MTREEAIKHGQEQLEVFGGEHREFIELAIKALEQLPKLQNRCHALTHGLMCEEGQEYYTVEANVKAYVKATCKEEAEIILHNCISIFPEEEYCDSIETKIVSVKKILKNNKQ